jgi:hypothetical protein
MDAASRQSVVHGPGEKQDDQWDQNDRDWDVSQKRPVADDVRSESIRRATPRTSRKRSLRGFLRCMLLLPWIPKKTYGFDELQRERYTIRVRMMDMEARYD